MNQDLFEIYQNNMIDENMEYEWMIMPVLKQYDAGDAVMILQEKLHILDFYSGSTTGSFDHATKEAVMNFQIANRLNPTGIVDEETWKLLFEKTTLPVNQMFIKVDNNEEESNTRQSNFVGIVIDPGHGGDDPGAIGNGIIEKNMNLENSLYMYRRFNELGVPVVLTRSTDETLTPTERVNRVLNAFGNSPNVIVLSNHINSGGGEGAEVIYALRNNNVLPNKILEEIGKAGQKTRRVYQRPSTTNPALDYYYMLRNTGSTQALIIEYGFLDNVNDANRLKRYHLDYVEAAIKAVMNYLDLPYNQEVEGLYTVVRGDTLWSIANRFGTTVDAIIRLNNLTSYTLNIGQQLRIPGAEIPEVPEIPSEGTNYTLHTVVRGDTLWSLANKFNTTVAEIRALNNLTSNTLSLGQILRIPGAEVPSEGTNYTLHTVVRGDTLWSLANQFNTTVAEIRALNNLTSDALSLGQVLRIPRAEIPGEGTNYTLHTVVRGDTLWSLASRFNTTVAEIRALNNLTSDALSLGQVLRIPSTFIVYTVVSGDTLWSIASRFRTTVDEIKRLNNLTSNLLSKGQQLLIKI